MDGLVMKRVKTRSLIQMEATECGAASLGIVLEHYGKWVPLEELRVACNVSRDGSNARDIVIAARQFGLEAKGYRYGIEGLQNLKPPFVVFWEFRHFLVVEGIGEKHVYVNDPETGPRKVSRQTFDESYTGLALGFRPGPDFVASGRRPGIAGDLLSRLKPSADGLYMLVIVSLLLVFPGLVIPGLSKVFIDTILIGGQDDLLRPLLVVVGVTAVALAVLTWLQEWCLTRMESKLALTGGGVYLTHLMRLPTRFYTQRHPGDLISRLLSNDAIANILGREIGRNFGNFLSVVFLGAVMFLYDGMLTMLAIGLCALSGVLVVTARRALADGSLRLEAENGVLAGVGANTIRSIESVKANGGEADAFTRWAGHHARTVTVQQSLARIANVIGILPSIAAVLASALIIGVGSHRIVEGALTVGGLVAFLALMAAFFRPFEALVQFVANLASAGAAFARVNDVLKHPVAEGLDPDPDRISRLPAEAKTRLDGHICLEGVGFSHSRSGPEVISNIDLNIPPGKRVVIVGTSGSGKSTLARVVAGLHTPQKGRVLCDGLPLLEIPPAVRAATIGWVSQEIVLFSGTVQENLTLFDTTIPYDAMISAARDAEIHEVIARRPGGYDSVLLEGGTDLSGGEAQRVEIARTLAGNPNFLVLDEATSALDPLVEEKIEHNLRQRRCGALVVAHRLSTVRDADEIVVLDSGRIVERGTHDQLLMLGGRYEALINP